MSEPTSIDEGVIALVERASAGDESAFESLARRYYERIHRWALARTGDPDDADDVAQEALLRMHRHLSSFDGRSRFTTWLYQVTRSAAADLHRKRGRRRRLHEKAKRNADPTTVDPRSDETNRHDERRAMGLVQTFLQELSERQREVFDLCDLQGYGPAEVSEMLEMEPVTVRSHLFRARKTMRKKILESAPELVEGYGHDM
ncbi:MAG: RNA polymerase sigma factor [Gemmatimonadetes bacterium]|uniref:RNA polymerase sigma factor n=1 Tax=Candidatus Kutchimonas denitrificans TaxID=3056748 RepID=A0AAE4ZC14_9BACT|nr:RNA polymerase sigma factor [Gemmatimonadota bacterium]NIR76672.1 RNA polymerase sigma factor [Candidatus Kutchimonas denitrificans]NIS02421.1 RNA polymerase sigma factor [Gemmatimonadota bacterium]NIT68325.1 RNA polymerase sigma factor [Gemmatimonadota bacterium]NIU54792.1 sigma-70 family RNA polymerase sigma factor [Gemmatimonadota bacterium]